MVDALVVTRVGEMETTAGDPDATAAGKVEVTASGSDGLGPALVACNTRDLTTAGSDENGISNPWEVVVVVCDVVVVVCDLVVVVCDLVVVVCDVVVVVCD